MYVRHSRLARLVALIVVGSMPLLGMAGVASAKSAKAWCATHTTAVKCKKGSGSSTGGGTGGPPVQITVQVDPNPLVETGQSEIHAVIQVETLPSFAGDTVNIDSSQLAASCSGGVTYETLQNGGGGITVPPQPADTINPRIDVVLDDDGNVTVTVYGQDCAPGTSVVEADLEVAPFLTALTTLVALPPVVTPEGVTAYPQTAGVAQEVETGDTSMSGDSDIYAVFYVETNPVYAEQTVELNSTQLESRCIGGWTWDWGNAGAHKRPVGTGIFGPVSTVIDDDGNAVFIFEGASCAAGTSQVIADVTAGTHPTYVTEFTVDPPAPTI
jgi:hypothetical protein